MIKDYFSLKIRANLPFIPTSEQDNCIKSIADFMMSADPDSAFILKGYAGTGKTSVVGAVVRTLDTMQQKCVLLAPTGRAAKIFALHATHPAYTIHKKIYRQRVFSNELDNFALGDNLHQHTLFIVDEASMVANTGFSGTGFGTGRLLEDLVRFVYAGQGCRIMFIGDEAQLPPVGETESPAMDKQVLKCLGLQVWQAELKEVMRQGNGKASGILYNATMLRQMIGTRNGYTFPMVSVHGMADIQIVNGMDLIEKITECYDRQGMDETIILCRSNKRALIYNNGIRNRILCQEDELDSGDLLMVAKNNYFWANDCKEMQFIANGEVAVVRKVRHERSLYGLRFADVTLRFPDYNDLELETTMLMDVLQTETPTLSHELNDKLYADILEDYADISNKGERMKKIKQDPYYNALQMKFAYAVTCHKAQGGQWANVFVDQGYLTEDMLNPDYYRWLYTAFTRATETLYLVNWPERQIRD